MTGLTAGQGHPLTGVTGQDLVCLLGTFLIHLGMRLNMYGPANGLVTVLGHALQSVIGLIRTTGLWTTMDRPTLIGTLIGPWIDHMEWIIQGLPLDILLPMLDLTMSL